MLVGSEARVPRAAVKPAFGSLATDPLSILLEDPALPAVHVDASARGRKVGETVHFGARGAAVGAEAAVTKELKKKLGVHSLPGVLDK